MKCALYVGAGTDTRPLVRLPTVERFVYVDGQPESEFPESPYVPGFARPAFLKQLDSAMSAVQFTLASVDDYLRTYRCGDRVVEYYTNTGVPSKLDRLPKSACDVIVCAGHDPDGRVLSHAASPSPLTFVGFQGSCYKSPEGPETLVGKLHNDPAARALFHRFYYFEPHTPFVLVYGWSHFLELV